ncbi:MAG: hypothetical protein AAF548_00135 [Actinomycetota bacterium]
MSRTIHRAFAVLAIVAGVWTAPAAAQDDLALAWSADATYVVEPAAGRVDVTFRYRFENVTTGVVFPGFFESLPADAVDVAATQGGTDLDVALVADDGEIGTWSVTFRSDVAFGGIADVELVWSFLAGTEPGPVIEPGAVVIDVFVPGIESAPDAVATVLAPDGYESVSELPSTTDDEGRSAVEVTAPSYRLTTVELLARGEFVGVDVELPPLARVESWPGDDEWRADVERRLGELIGELDAWFGSRTEPFTVQRTLETREASIDGDVVTLPDSSTATVDRQLARLWLADVIVDEPWFSEGLALGFAGEAGDAGSAESLVAGLVGELGSVGVRAVVDALRDESPSYPGEGSIANLPPDWRRLLDVVERVGGVEDAATSFRAIVTAELGDAQIDRRAAALVDYEALETRAGTWTLPPFLREAMSLWDFDTFSARQGEVSDVIVTRDSLEAWADSLDLAPRADTQLLFESATDDLTDVEALLAAQEEALAAFDEAEAAVNGDRGLLARVGLIGADPDGELGDLRDAWAAGEDATVEHDGHELAETMEGAVGRGTIRLLVPIAVVIAAWQGVRWIRRRRPVLEATDGQSENVSA